jgi:cell pole-organizing protein PopZ
MDLDVDELIASIRKSVDSDMDSLAGETRGTLMRGALREMRVSMDGGAQNEAVFTPGPPRPEELSSLRERIRRNVEHNEILAAAQPAPPPPSSYAQSRPEPAVPPTPQRPQRNDFSGIMALPSPGRTGAPPQMRPGYAHQETDDLRYQRAQWSEPPQPPIYEDPQGAYGQPLLSSQAEAATEHAFRHLSDTLLSRALGERGIEDVTREMLRSMIKQWLDANLPGMVEALVREEIERVARRGR